MKRLHVHLSVNDLEKSILFYNQLFSSEPAVTKDDYAKWMLDDPRVNFAISTRSMKKGLDHLGLQAESEPELADIKRAMERANQPVVDEPGATCCYARSDKHWTIDPDGLAWEGFHSLESIPTYGKTAKSTGVDSNSITEKKSEDNGLLEASDAENGVGEPGQAACCISKIKPPSTNSCC